MNQTQLSFPGADRRSSDSPRGPRRTTRRTFLALTAVGSLLSVACASQSAPSSGSSAAPTQAPAAAPTSPPAAAATPATAAATQAPAATSAPATGQKATIEVWNADWGQLFNDLMTKIGTSFTEANPSVDIHWQFLPQIEQKLLTAYAGGNPPDTHYTNYEFQGTLNYQNVLRSLTSYVKDAGLSDADFIQAVYIPCTFKGNLLALPGGSDWIVNFYNKDMLSGAGLDPNKPPLSFQEVSDTSAKLLKKNGGGQITQMGFWPQNFLHVLFLFGGKLYDEANQKVTPTDPQVVAALEWETSIAKSLDMTKVDAFWSGQPGISKPGNPFATGRSAFLWDGFWDYDPLDKYAPKLNYGISYLPTPHGQLEEIKNQMLPWWAYAVPTKATHPDQAWSFDKYAFIDQAALMGYETLNGPCVLKAIPAWEDGVKKTIGPQNRMSPYLDVFANIAKNATNYFPSIPVTAMYSDQLNRAFDQAVHGKQSPKDALQAVADAVQPELEKALKSS